MKKKTYISPELKTITMSLEGIIASSPSAPTTTMPDYSGDNDMFGGSSSSSVSSTREFSLQDNE